MARRETAAVSMRPETMAAGLRAAAERGALQLPTAGTSMGGVLHTGDRAVVVPGARPRWGEVWVFCTAEGAVTVHRCRGRRPGGWLFQGDRRSVPDPVVTADRLVGRVVAVERGGRRHRLGALDRWGRSAAAMAVRLRHR
jgi:hypothetical protein